MQKIENDFLQSAYEELPRLLGQLNRNPGSKSFGSFDRAFWHYRTNDVSSCRYQEAVYTLALLYCSDFEGNRYYRDEKILVWIRASLLFTTRLQQRNGSFDEWYIHEGSYVGTAFLTAALSQTMLILKKNGVTIPEEPELRKCIHAAAIFLLKNTEKTVLNQVSGAIFAIAAVGEILENNDIKKDADVLLDAFLSEQRNEGWWSEYGGPDIGYLSLTVSYLYKYKCLTRSKKVDEPIERAKHFVESFIHVDATAGGEYMSRNTEYIIPSGALPYLGAVKPAHLDDRYLCYILYNWIEAGLDTAPQPIPRREASEYFEESAIMRIYKEPFFLAANGMKGGVFRLYVRGGVYYDCGIEITESHQVFTTGILDNSNSVSYKNNTLHVSGYAKVIKEPLLDTKTALLFKAWQYVFGRFRIFQKILKIFLRKQMVSYAGQGTIPFTRTVEYTETQVTITDVIQTHVPSHDILFGVKAAYTAVPSSKYAPCPEISNTTLIPHIEKKHERGIFTLTRTFLLQ